MLFLPFHASGDFMMLPAGCYSIAD